VGTVGGDLDGPALAWRCCSYRVLTVLAEGRQFVEGELAVRDNLTPQDLASCLDELTQRLTLPPAALIRQRPSRADRCGAATATRPLDGYT
jgi:hypothetical protein